VSPVRQHVMEDWTAERLRVVTADQTPAALREYVDEDQIPEEYGGTLRYGDEPHSVRYTSPYEMELRTIALTANKRLTQGEQGGEGEGQEMVPRGA
jgi:hypothetical protein